MGGSGIRFVGAMLLCLAGPAEAIAADLDVLPPEALYPLAREEGRVVIYSATSRIHKIEPLFEARYPGIDLIAFDIGSMEQVTRLKAERRAGIRNADVVYLTDAAALLRDWSTAALALGYVPPRMETRIPYRYREPLLAHRLSTKVLMYNAADYPDGPPVHNLWQLTEPDWHGRVILVDPAMRTDYLDLIGEFLLRSAELGAAYQRLFGRPLALPPGVACAGEQFVRALFDNGAILVSNTRQVNEAIGRPGQSRRFVGFATYSDLRSNAANGWALEIAADVDPAPGIVYPVIIAPVADAPHPAAARLLIDFMMGDNSERGGPAVAPFVVPGDYLTRVDIPAHPDAVPLSLLAAWRTDPARGGPLRQRTFDLVLALE